MKRAPHSQALLPNVLLALLVTCVTAGLLEAGARVVERRRPRTQPAEYISNWQRQWDGDFYTIRSEGIGWPSWEEFNGDGLRDRTHAVQKPEGVWRVVFLGDSVTLGSATEAHEAYPQVLQGLIDERGIAAEVLNVALWGWSTRQQRIAYERIARKYQPDQVVVAVCLNDIPEIQNNLSRPPAWLARLHERSALVRLAVDAQGREVQSVEELIHRAQAPKVRRAYERFFAEMRALRDEVTRDGASFSVIVFPFRFQILKGAPEPVPQRKIAAFCEAERIPCFDFLTPVWRAGGEAFADYDHFSVAGSRAVAAEILSGGVLPSVPEARESLRGSSAAASLSAWLEGRAAADLRTVSTLSGLLSAPDADTRRAAAWALERIGPAAATAVPALVSRLEDRKEVEIVRAAAARALAAFGAAGRGATAALLSAVSDSRQAVSWAAARALPNVGSFGAGDVPALAALLENDDSFVRGFAAFSLGNLGATAAPAVPALIKALRHEDGYGRGGAAGALAKLGAAAVDAVPALLEGLRDPDGDRRWKAARTLGRVGPGAVEAVPALITALRDSNEYVRRHAARALGRIGGDPATLEPALRQASTDADEAVRKEAAEALERLRRGR